MPDFEKLADAKKYLRESWEDGVSCPCCGQFVKRYKIPINTSMAVWLILLVKTYHATKDWVSVQELAVKSGMRGGDYAKLRYWGLIEQKDKDVEDETKRNSGYWKPTDKGILFVNEMATVPKYIFTYNRKLLGFSEEHTTIIDSLGTRFNYADLMGSDVLFTPPDPEPEEDDELMQGELGL